jgi:hypothetical protein
MKTNFKTTRDEEVLDPRIKNTPYHNGSESNLSGFLLQSEEVSQEIQANLEILTFDKLEEVGELESSVRKQCQMLSLKTFHLESILETLEYYKTKYDEVVSSYTISAKIWEWEVQNLKEQNAQLVKEMAFYKKQT